MFEQSSGGWVNIIRGKIKSNNTITWPNLSSNINQTSQQYTANSGRRKVKKGKGKVTPHRQKKPTRLGLNTKWRRKGQSDNACPSVVRSSEWETVTRTREGVGSRSQLSILLRNLHRITCVVHSSCCSCWTMINQNWHSAREFIHILGCKLQARETYKTKNCSS